LLVAPTPPAERQQSFAKQILLLCSLLFLLPRLLTWAVSCSAKPKTIGKETPALTWPTDGSKSYAITSLLLQRQNPTPRVQGTSKSSIPVEIKGSIRETL
jgi:hypothetical protein